MGKMLLQSLSNTEANEITATVTSADENKTLNELMHEMKSQLEEASDDLLQPRKEAVDKLLRTVLH